MQNKEDSSSRTMHELIRTIAAVVAAVAAVVGVGVVVKVVIVGPSSPKANVHPLSHPGAPAYLEKLPSSGDTPESGYIEAAGRALRHSIFYDNVGAASTSSKCEMIGGCRFTSYELDGRYSTFTASFAVTTKNANSTSGDMPSAHWHVSIDGHSLGEGEVSANVAPRPIFLELDHGHVLEPTVTANEPGINETINVLWGNARVS